jgi:metal-dependent amidase/aminoacylase/carboxypeptidase family protein
VDRAASVTDAVVEAKRTAQTVVERRMSDLVDLSHRIHATPELSFDEHSWTGSRS